MQVDADTSVVSVVTFPAGGPFPERRCVTRCRPGPWAGIPQSRSQPF